MQEAQLRDERRTEREVRITYLQRKKGEFWSLEEIFATVRAHLPPACSSSVISAPAHGASVPAIMRNLAWARSLRGEIFHVTGDIHYAILALRRGIPSVLTVHDVRFLEGTRGLKRFLLWLFWIYLPGKAASRVTAVSDATARQLVSLGRVAAGKIRVIPNPVSPEFQAKLKEWSGEEPVLLHVGTTANKNLDRVIQACEGLRVRLWVLGRLSSAQRRLLEESRVPFHQWQDLARSEVAGLYERCDVVVFPSVYEGFGMPILEGQAVGRPVLTSDRSPMREVAGGGALLVDPEDFTSIRSSLQRLLSDAGLRSDLIRKGFSNVRNYTPEAVASQYAALYQELAVL